jgi:death-on-curing protein
VREPTWVALEVVLAIHDAQIAEHRGGTGIRDRGLLESALARPRNAYTYGGRSLAGLAAQYAFGQSRNHPFVDGNKRTSLAIMELFLLLNGIELTASDAECVTEFLGLAAGEVDAEQLQAWIARYEYRRNPVNL